MLSRNIFTSLYSKSETSAYATLDYSFIYIIGKYLGMVLVGKLHQRYSLINGVQDDVINVIT